MHDDDGRPFQTWTVCAYCGCSELRIEPDQKEDEPGRRR